MEFRPQGIFRLTFCAVALLLVISVSTAAQSGRIQPTPTPENEEAVKIVTEEVNLNVLAFDEEGKFVGDLKEGDLVITENNILHQPTSVRRVAANVLIVMDTGGELRSVKSLDQTRKTAKGIVAALRPGDSVAVLQYADKAEILSEWTSDKQELLKAINRSKFGRRSVFVDAIRLATDFMINSAVSNKHMVLITDGTDSLGRGSEKFDAFKRLLGTDISVHVISYTRMEATEIEPRTKSISKSPPPQALPDEVKAGLPNGVRDIATSPKIGPTINLDRTLIKKLKARKADLEISEEQLGALAENTNGEMIVPTSLEEMVDKTALVAKMIDASYVVTYTPKIPLTENSNERLIDVTSKRSGLIVQSRRKLIAIPAN